MQRLFSGHLSRQIHGNLGLSIHRNHRMDCAVYGFDLDTSTRRDQVSPPRAHFAERLSGDPDIGAGVGVGIEERKAERPEDSRDLGFGCWV